MLRTHSLFKRISAAAASAAIAAVSFSGVSAPLSASAEDGISLGMKVLAGGSQIGMAFIVSGAPDGFTFSIDGTEQTPAADGSFLAPENAMDIGHRHKIVISKDGETLKESEISVVEYLQSLMQYSEYADYKPLALSMLKYGGAAQKYFGIDLTEDIQAAGDADIAEVDVNIDASPFDKDTFNDYLAEEEAPVRYYGMNLSLLSETTFRLFFEKTTGVTDAASFFTNATFSGEAATVANNGDRFMEVSISVPASKLTDIFTLESLMVDQDFSPAQYLAAAQNSGDDDLALLCRTLYAYSVEAKKLADNPPQPPQPSEEQWESLDVFSGEATFYDYSVGNACLDDFIAANSMNIAALTDDQYHEYVGGYIEITRGDAKIGALVGDIMPFADNPNAVVNDVDLNESAFEQLGDKVEGRIPVSWRLVPLPTAENAPIRFKIKEGANAYWTAIQIQNSTYPVKELQIKQGDTYVSLPRMSDCYNYFLAENGVGTGSTSFKIIDIFGQEIIEENISLNVPPTNLAEPLIVEGTQQFPK